MCYRSQIQVIQFKMVDYHTWQIVPHILQILASMMVTCLFKFDLLDILQGISLPETTYFVLYEQSSYLAKFY